MIISFLVLLIGIAAGFIDSTVGSGGLISIPFLIFFGLSPQAAIATDRLGSIGQILAALLKYGRAKKILWQYVPIFIVLSFFGSIIGANILLAINQQILQKIVAILLLVILPFIFLKPSLGVQHINTSNFKKGAGLIIYFLIMIYNGFFGTGAGPFSSFNFMFFFGLTIIESNATNLIPWLVLSLSSLFIFAQNNIIDYQKGIFLLIGMILGGYLGAHIAINKGNLWIKRLFGIMVIISCMKLLFF